jgi:hypothetical protein
MQAYFCSKCGVEGFHYDEKLRAFTCELVDGKKVILFDENGNEKV